MKRKNGKVRADDIIDVMLTSEFMRCLVKRTAAYLKMSMSHFSHIAPRLPRVKAGRKWLYTKKQINQLLIQGKL